MTDAGRSLLGLGGLEDESHPHVLGACAAQPQLIGEVAAQRAGDEEKRLAILDRLSELPVHAREKWWAPRFELIWFEASREQRRVPPIATEMAFELARAASSHRAVRVNAAQVGGR